MRYTVENYPYEKVKKAKFLPWPRGRRANYKKGWYYKDLVCAFDIETTYIEEINHNILYLWQCAIETDIIFGRTWEDFKMLLDRLQDNLNNEKLVFYVHNLSYEFQFFSGIYNFEQNEVFALERRKVAKCEMRGCFEFRCSYIHSNMSLAEWTKKLGVEHGKLVGNLDYTEKYYPWSELPEKVYAYGENDALGIVEAIHAEMEADGDTLCTIPLTSTGYVRRDFRKAMEGWNHAQLDELKPDLHLWEILREAFRGGDTHANRYYSGMILENVRGVDRTSSYPDVIVNKNFPMKPFQTVHNPTPEKLVTAIKKRKRACLVRLKFGDISLSDTLNGFPYLTVDKCRNKVEYEADNGRILNASYLECTLTDVDFLIVMKEYKWQQIEVVELLTSRYDKLPEPIRKTVLDYFQRKTDLKGIKGQEIYYMKSKNKLNSSYGCMAQNPVKQSAIFDGGEWSIADEEQQKILDVFNGKSWGVYQWGVWVTAWARYELRKLLWIAGHDAVYCDTDSVKHTGEIDWTKYNNEQKTLSERNGATAIKKDGSVEYMGLAEADSNYKRFITHGAKKYAYEDGEGLHITVAGVGKKKGAAELEKLGGLEAFKPGLIFSEAGGTESVYNDNEPFAYMIDGNTVEITRNIVIKPSTYTLGITAEYAEILQKSKYILEEIQRTY